MLIACLFGAKGGVNDVCEKQRSENAIGASLTVGATEEFLQRGDGRLGVLKVRVVVAPLELDQLRAVDVFGEVATVRQRSEPTVNPVKNEGRNMPTT